MQSITPPYKNINSDGKNQTSRILIGLSGGVESFVCAYLLKIQKHELVAATVVNTWTDRLAPSSSPALACSISEREIDFIRKFCQKLNIPHSLITIGDEFMEKVVEERVRSYLEKKNSRHCLWCKELKLIALYQKMKDLGAVKLATGHFAKIMNSGTREGWVPHLGANPLPDHAWELSLLSQEILSSLVLPLGDLTQKEVALLGENFDISQEFTQSRTNTNTGECLSLSQDLVEKIQQRVPSFLKERFEVDKPETLLRGRPSPEVKKNSFLGKKIWLKLLHSLHPDGALGPNSLQGVVTTSSGQSSEGWIHPKTLSTIVLELDSPLELFPGEVVRVLNKKGKNSKVICLAEVRSILEIYEEDKVKTNKEHKDEGEVSEKVIDVGLDF